MDFEQADKLYLYDPDTGKVTRKQDGNNAVKKGSTVGWVSTCGYLRVKSKGKKYQLHRIIWLLNNGRWPNGQVDHINGVRTDNRMVNLREVSNQENQRNKALSSLNTSGFIGVCLNKSTNKWVASITISSKKIYIGCYSDWFDAVCARKSASNKYGFHKNHGSIRDNTGSIVHTRG